MKRKVRADKAITLARHEAHVIRHFFLNAALCFILYMAFAGRLSLSEIIAGLCTAFIASFLMIRIESRTGDKFKIQWRWFPPLLKRTSLNWLIDTGLVLRALWKYLAHGTPIHGRLLDMPVNKGKDEPYTRARLALIIAFSTVPPNSVSIMIDRQKRSILVHRLVETDAQPGGGNRQWPL